MAACALASTAAVAGPRQVVAGRQAFAGRPVVAHVPARTVCRVNTKTVASVSAQEKLAAGVSAGFVAAMANPLVAQAGVTPSLKNLIGSLIAGGVVAAVIAAAVTAVSNFDQLDARK